MQLPHKIIEMIFIITIILLTFLTCQNSGNETIEQSRGLTIATKDHHAILVRRYSGTKTTVKLNMTEIDSHSRCNCAKSKSKYKIAINFYGLSSSLEHTLPSLERHLFKILDAESICYDVFWYTLSNPTSQGANNIYKGNKPHDVDNIKPCRFSIVDYNTVTSIEYKEFLISRNTSTAIMDDSLNTKNLLGMLHSLTNANEIMEIYGEIKKVKYDLVFAVRADVALISNIDFIHDIKKIKEEKNKIWFSKENNGNSYNDRIAYGSIDVMKLFFERGIYLRDSEFRGDGDNLLRYALEKKKINIECSRIQGIRVRGDGRVQKNDIFTSKKELKVNPNDLKRCVIFPGRKFNSSTC